MVVCLLRMDFDRAIPKRPDSPLPKQLQSIQDDTEQRSLLYRRKVPTPQKIDES